MGKNPGHTDPSVTTPAAASSDSVAVDAAAAVSPTDLRAPEPDHPEPVLAHPTQEAHGTPFGRIPITAVEPVIEGGAYPAKATVGESFDITATIFREGHDAVNATVLLTAPDGSERQVPMAKHGPEGLNGWLATVTLDSPGPWTYRIEAWDDPWGTWHHAAVVKFGAGIDTELVCAEGRQLFEWAAEQARTARDQASLKFLSEASNALTPNRLPQALAELADDPYLAEVMARYGPRRLVTPTPEIPIWCDRRRALFGSWYEFFPRSQGAVQNPDGSWTSGTLRSSRDRLDEVAAMGFDVVYLPPIHPIGQAYRKGPNNTLTPGPYDPGSPWAIGAATGGHDAIHPDLGDFDDFDAFVDHARDLGMEVALDLALQASPDHPWVSEHPEWFTTRIDGTIAYAENPPKKYQDIYPINFDNDPDGIYAEVLRIVNLWIDHGVTLFRVDNPHTKPLNFWAWLLAEVRKEHPEVIFLAEAFTRPAMMHALGKIGFHQSYTYFTWRNEKWELEEYLTELTTETDSFFRPNFFVNTPDILPGYLVDGGPAAFTIRAVLASMLSPTWGVYSGFELFENLPVRPGSEEYLDSEKYQYRPRDYDAEPNLNILLTRLNEIRDEHPALQQLRNLTFHHAPNSQVIVFSKQVPTADGSADRVLCAVSLNPQETVESEVYLDFAAMGLQRGETITVTDQLTHQSWTWGESNYVRLYPAQPAHIFTVRRDGTH
ncbi:alpha-1,4-glucan--maltose-1-phosphate maltosyltransferase [Naumannella halotolerans]|uniref:Alpha-1,4-glucan:maltose-1-phosphate maltosyltransferase n=1 Tax=Naumannella halotolerans TaxID=993414 RepID=A0A4R7JB17_9ACTN|nr:starch synthase (maltosyl-transferring) [Naumannella halotolerans]